MPSRFDFISTVTCVRRSASTEGDDGGGDVGADARPGLLAPLAAPAPAPADARALPLAERAIAVGVAGAAAAAGGGAAASPAGGAPPLADCAEDIVLRPAGASEALTLRSSSDEALASPRATKMRQSLGGSFFYLADPQTRIFRRQTKDTSRRVSEAGQATIAPARFEGHSATRACFLSSY